MDDDDNNPITYVLPDRDQFGIDLITQVPAIGTGVMHHGITYRVKDVWLIEDSQGPLASGFNVFLEHVPIEKTALADFDPDYFD